MGAARSSPELGTPPPGAPGARFTLVALCFFLSGFAALLYETAWSRQFAFVFGTSELAVAAVLAAYMAGLALGAALAARIAPRLTRPVLAYGVLELGIAIGALAVPLGIRLTTALYLRWLGGLDAAPETLGLATALFHLAGAFVVLVPCTAMMGATLPLLARYAVREEEQIGPRVGLLYAVNTGGAILGAVAAAFLLLPELGLRQTVYVGAACNLLVFAAAAALAGSRPEALPAGAPRGSGARWILPLIAVSGAVSFVYEVLWTRLLGHVLGGSTQAFATMLASFLLGIALGSAVASRLARSARRAAVGFGLAQLGTALMAWASFALADRLPALAAAVGATPRQPAPGAWVAGAALLPVTLCIGATFPFAVRLLAARAEEAAAASARTYSWNTIGSIVGAIAAGFLLLPTLGIDGTLRLAVAGNLALALATALLAAPRQLGLAAAAGATALALATMGPGLPLTLLRTSALTGKPARDEILHIGVGRSATVTLLGDTRGWRILTNGLPESMIHYPGVPPVQLDPAEWLSLAPVLARPGIRRMLIIGLGGGLTLATTPESVETIDVIELEPEVVEANRMVVRAGRDPLSDPRLTLHLGDARGALTLAEGRFDAIVSQPSHPWTSGASHLYTREFFELVRSRLTDEGVFVQWIGLPFVDRERFRSLLAALTDAFEYVEVLHVGAAIFLASDAPLDILSTAAEVLPRADFTRHGIDRVEDVAATVMLDPAGSRAVAGDAEPNSDDHNRLANSRPGGGSSWLMPLVAAHDPLPARVASLETGPLARRLAEAALAPRTPRLADSLPPADREILLGWRDYERQRPEAATRHFQAALEAGANGGGALEGLALLGRAPDPDALAPRTRAVIEGRRLERDGDWEAVRALEEGLAAWTPGELLYPEAAGLRAAWRIAEGSPERAAEAIALIDTLLKRRLRPARYLQRARAAEQAGQPEAAWGSLAMLARALRPGERPQRLARAGLEIGRRLEPSPRHGDVLARLRRLSR